MNPIGLIITGVGLLVAGIVLLYKHWDAVWTAMKAAVDWVWSGIKTGWDAVVMFFRTGFEWLAGLFGSLGEVASGVFSRIWAGLKSGFMSAADWIIGKVNGLLSGLNALTGLVGVEIPLIPKIETGSEVIKAAVEPMMANTPTGISSTPTLVDSFVNRLTTPAAEIFKPAPSNNVVTNAVTTSRSSQTVHVDRSIRDVRITINTVGQDAKSLKEQLLEVFAELAAQGDGIEGVIVNA